jgi:hypothetical protein
VATPVYLEVGQKRVFACAYDWPGWCRSARDEEGALDALRAYLPRYLVAVAEAGLRPPDAALKVEERLAGSATTDFGAPGAISVRDSARATPADGKRIAALVRAAWTVFDRVVAGAPAELRKGPRGGGRERDMIVEHVYGAESAYASKLRLRLRQPAVGDSAALEAAREALLEALQHPPVDARWPALYAARRIAWHVLDHAWEIEDRSA